MTFSGDRIWAVRKVTIKQKFRGRRTGISPRRGEQFVGAWSGETVSGSRYSCSANGECQAEGFRCMARLYKPRPRYARAGIQQARALDRPARIEFDYATRNRQRVAGSPACRANVQRRKLASPAIALCPSRNSAGADARSISTSRFDHATRNQRAAGSRACGATAQMAHDERVERDAQCRNLSSSRPGVCQATRGWL